EQACYTGPAGTEGVGTCVAGTKLCALDGTCGVCVGEVLPIIEGFSCINQEADVNCNSQLDYLEAVCLSSCPEGTIFDDTLGQCKAPACEEAWACGDWSACVAETQTRTCTDANLCGTELTKPLESQACEFTASGGGGGGSSGEGLSVSSSGGGSSGGGGGRGGSYSSGAIIQNVLSPSIAGNGICEKGESAANVCFDCACASGYTCAGNSCVLASSSNNVLQPSTDIVINAKLPNKMFGKQTHFKVPGALAGLGGLTVFLMLASYIKLHRKNAVRSTSASETPPKSLQKYIQKELAEGYSADEVKARLAEAGWQEEQINDAFKNK
ncbi:MAG: hypothetical protein AABX75_02800, partial [Nanoarchaeota archaeon]